MIYLFLANGFEEIEALATVDILRRAALSVTTVSITSELIVHGAHGIDVKADALFADTRFADIDALVLPGGMPGAANLDACAPLHELLQRAAAEGAVIAAICAAPLVLGHAGLLQGRRATCYPGFEAELLGATHTGALVERDGNVITGKGPGAAFEFGYTLVDVLTADASISAGLRQGMIYN